VGWAIAEHMRTELVADAGKAADAVWSGLAGAIFHSDHGSRYTSGDFVKVCRSWGLPGRWRPSVPVLTARWPNRSMQPSNAKPSKTIAAGPPLLPAAARSSGG
jgi:transposase InsO family protein